MGNLIGGREMLELRDFLMQAWADLLFQWAVCTVLAGLVLGVLAAIKRGDFTFALLGDWLRDKVLYLLLPYVVVAALASVIDGPFTAMAPLAWVTVELSLLASIYNALRDLGLGGWLPETKVTRADIC